MNTMIKKIKKKIIFGVLALNILGTAMAPGILTVSASNNSSEGQQIAIQKPDFFVIVDDTTLFDKRDQALYMFDSKEDLLLYTYTAGNHNGDTISNTTSNIVPPTPYNQWKTIRTSTFSKAEVKKWANDVKKAQAAGAWATYAAPWLYKFPGFGATVGTIGALMQGHQQIVIDAANKNQRITAYYDQRIDWNGYGPRTRMRLARHF